VTASPQEHASTLTQNPATADDPKAICARSIHIMGNGDLGEFEAVIHAEAVNREAGHEPMAARGSGPAAFYATARWLRGAFSDLLIVPDAPVPPRRWQGHRTLGQP
jgi:hypothetical protein